MWLLVLVIYAAPPDAVDWDGPWKVGMTKVLDDQYHSEAECRNFAIRLIGKMHDGMLAPMRFQCVEFPADLPKGAPR